MQVYAYGPLGLRPQSDHETWHAGHSVMPAASDTSCVKSSPAGNSSVSVRSVPCRRGREELRKRSVSHRAQKLDDVLDSRSDQYAITRVPSPQKPSDACIRRGPNLADFADFLVSRIPH